QDLMNFANNLKNFIVKQGLYTNIQGKNYVNVEGWQFAGGNMGLFPVVEKCERLNRQGETIYQASVAIYHNDKIISRGIAVCSSKEKGKNQKDEYVIASMAQTRAVGKAYRLIIGWLMKAAGYEVTPAEEMKEIVKTKTRTDKERAKNNVDYVGQVKAILFKKGAKNEKEALEILKKKTGLVWKSFKGISPVAAQRALAEILRK
ncbi:MAG: hypothetical protein ABIM64_05545, partial [candidate division WOR-3 bacterium]